jgi:hypothetical protein
MKIYNININEIKNNYFSICKNDYGIISFLEFSCSFIKDIKRCAETIDYSNYYSLLNNAKLSFYETKKALLNYLSLMFNEINSVASNNKFSKFDLEIEGYRQTIEEKNNLISKGIEVLSNKRRVEILTKKINDLLLLKEKFEDNSTCINDRKTNQFIERCKSIIENTYSNHTTLESIESIVKSKEISKESELDCFVLNHLFKISEFIKNGIDIIEKMLLIDIPISHSVYEKNGQQYIIINDENEFYSTKQMCEKYKLLCLTRR